jgi:hypothetical protein
MPKPPDTIFECTQKAVHIRNDRDVNVSGMNAIFNDTDREI